MHSFFFSVQARALLRVPHQQVKLLELPLPNRSLLSELTLDEADDLVELGTAWASLGTIIPCSSPGSESTGNNSPLSRFGSFVGGACNFYWSYAGGFLLKSCEMLSSLLDLRFVHSELNFWLLDAGIKQSDRQLQFDSLISPGHINSTPLDLYHPFLIGGNHTLLNNSHIEAMPGNDIYLHQRIGEYCSSAAPAHDKIAIGGDCALVILLSLISILLLASFKYLFLLYDQRLQDDTPDCNGLPVCDDKPDDSYSFLFGIDDDEDIDDAGNASDDDAGADADELACFAADDDSLCYSQDSDVAADDENSIFSVDSSADVEVDNDLTPPVIETLCSDVDVPLPIVEVCYSAPQLRRSPCIAKMKHVCYKKFF